MDFIKRMKKREFVEMSLKFIATLCAVFLAVILMEGMIYGIQLKAVKENEAPSKNSGSTIAYCIEEENDKYKVLFYNQKQEGSNLPEWSSSIGLVDKEDCTEEGLTVYKVIFDAPNAFEFSIKGWHFIIIGTMVAAAAGYFTYRFIRLGQSYKKIEEQYLKDGTIEITNV